MDEVESSSPMGGGECSESPAHLIEPQVELNEGFEPSSLEPNVEIAETAEQYAYGFYTGADESSALRSNYNEDASEIAMDTSNSGAYDSSCKEEETNYNEMQRTYLTNFFTSDYQKNSGAVEDSPIDPNIERIPLSRFPSIVKVVERAEYETIQILYQLLYQRSAWDTQELLTKRILEFSGFMFGKNSEEYYNREMLLQTLPNSTLVKIGAILCLDHVKNVLSNVGLGRIDLINAILEFLALPKKKTRAPRQSVHRPSIQLNQSTNAPPCGCRNFCLGKFTEKEREHILNYFSQLRQKKKQDAYFFNLIKFHKSATAKKQPRRSSSPDDEESFVSPKKSRDYKYYYKVKIGTLEVDVCKSAFMILHNLKMSTLNHFQARLKKGCYLSKAVVAATVCPPLEGQETPSKEEPKASTSSNAEPSTTELESVKKEAPSNEKEPSNEIVSNSVEHTEEESKDCSVENSVSNSTEESMESMSSKTEDKEDTEKKFPVKVEKSVSENDIVEEMDISTKDSTEVVEKVKTEDGIKQKLKDFPMVVKCMDEASEELLIDLHFLLFLSGADSGKSKEKILEFDGYTFSSESEEFDERKEFLQRMSGKLLTDVARAFSLGVMSKREETIENILAFLMKPQESFLRSSPSVPVILSDVELDDIEGFSDSDESITCEVVEKKVECIDLLAEDDDLSSGGEDSDGEKKKKRSDQKASVATPQVETVQTPVTVDAPNSGSVRTLRDFETIRKIVNTHPPEYLVDIYELLYLKKHEPASLREEILDFSGFNFDKTSTDYVKRKQVLDRMLYNNVRRVYNTLIHNSTEVKVFSKPTMINEIFQFLFKLPDHDTSVRPLPPGAKTLMPKQTILPLQKNKPSAAVSAPNVTVTPPSIIPGGNSGKLSDLKRVFQRVACFPCEYLVDVHKLLFMTDCDSKVIRQNIFGFKGFSFGRDSPEFQQRKMYLEYLTFHSLRKISSVLTTRSVDLRNSTKHELASHLTDVLAEYCNTHVETSSIVPTLSSASAPATSTPTTSNSSVEKIVVTPSIEGLQAADSSTSTAANAVPNNVAATKDSPSINSMNISIVDARSVNATPTPSQAPRTRKRKSQPTKQIPTDTKKPVAPPPQQAEFADINLPEIEQYRQIYGTNLNVYPNVPTITGIASFGTGVSQPFPQIVPQTVAFPLVPQYIQQPQIVGLQSTAITMPSSIITQVASNPTEVIVPADIEKPVEESKTSEKMEISKSTDLDEEDGDKPLASLIGHPIDSVLEKNINDIVQKTNLQDITMNKVIQKIYDLYPKFDLSYRKEFIKSTLRTILYKLGNDNQNTKVKKEERDSNSPDCSVTTTDRDNSLPESPE